MLSPDGTRVAFERSDPVAGNADIWIVNADGTNEMAMTQTDQFEDWPSWSPDGTRLLFARSYVQGTDTISEIVIRTVGAAAQLEPPESDTVATILVRSLAITARTVRWRGRPTGRWSPGPVAAAWLPSGRSTWMERTSDG